MKKTSLILIFSAAITSIGTTLPMCAWLARGARAITGRVPVRAAAKQITKAAVEQGSLRQSARQSWQSTRARAAAARKFVANHKGKIAVVGLTGATAATAGAGWAWGLDEDQREDARRNLAEIARRSALSVRVLRGDGLPAPVVLTPEPVVVRKVVDKYEAAHDAGYQGHAFNVQVLRDCGLNPGANVPVELRKLCVKQHEGFAAALEASIANIVAKRTAKLKKRFEESEKDRAEIEAYKNRHGLLFTSKLPVPASYQQVGANLPVSFVSEHQVTLDMQREAISKRTYHAEAAKTLGK